MGRGIQTLDTLYHGCILSKVGRTSNIGCSLKFDSEVSNYVKAK